MKPTTKAESRLAEESRSGAELDCRDLSGEDANIRPQFLRALMLGQATDKAGGEPIRPPGAVRLSWATITGKLDLSLLGSSGATLPGLILEHCKIEGEVDLSGARIGEVDLRWRRLKAFKAPPCESPAWFYAIDAMLPIIDLGVESGRGFLDGAGCWQLFKLFVAIAGAIAIPLAALTFAGLLQRA